MPFELRPFRVLPGTARPPGHRGRLVLVAHGAPYPPRAGNEARLVALADWLVDVGWEVLVVACPATEPSGYQLDRAARARPEVIVVTHPGVVHHGAAVAPELAGLAGRTAAPVGPLLGEPADQGEPAGRVAHLARGLCPDVLVEAVRHLARTWHPDVVVVEYAFLSRVLPFVGDGVIRVIDTIDVLSRKAGEAERAGVPDQYALDPASERALLLRSDTVVAIEPGEATLLAALVPERPVVMAGIGARVIEPRPGVPPGRVALVVGSDNPRNLAGLTELVRRAWPRVRSAVPDAELHVVGRSAASAAHLNGGDGVHLIGEVDELAGYYAAARVVVNPARAGTGLKVKTLEGLAHLRPIVAWPSGVDGLADECRRFCDVVDGWDAFADRVIARLLDRTVLAELAARREVLAAELSAPVAYGALDAALARRVGAARRARQAGRLAPPVERPRRLLTLLARHGTDRYPDAVPALRDLLQRRLPDVEQTLVVVDNAPAGPGPRGLDAIAGSNASWEFSAWDDAVAHVGARLDEADLVCLATSAFAALDAAHLELVDSTVLGALAPHVSVVGHIDRFDGPVEAFGTELQAWLRSSFLVVAPATLRRLGSLVSVADPSVLFSGDPAAPFRPDAPISAAYRRYLIDWITGPGTGQGVAWHSRFDLDATSLPRFEAKATAILNEQLLSARLGAAGCHLVDLTWLARAVRRAPDRCVAAIPDWPAQIAGRAAPGRARFGTAGTG